MSKHMNRVEGAEQPYIPLGAFKLRIPFVHFKVAMPELFQGALLVTVVLAAVPFVQESLGVRHEVAVIFALGSGAMYAFHAMLGDPVIPGWITPMIPLSLMWVTTNFEAGTDRIHAVIALQMTMAIIFLTLGITGFAKKISTVVPRALRGGILLGAGIAAVYSIIPTASGTSRLDGVVISGTVALVIALVSMYAVWVMKRRDQNKKFFILLTKYGVLPALIVAYVVGVAVGELSFPTIQWGIIEFPIAEIISGYTIFGIGFPPVGHFLSALPVAMMAYVVAFGDVILAESAVKAVDEARTDEKVEYNVNRSHLICGARNLVQSLFTPFIPLQGPQWVGPNITTYERYRLGRKSMDTIYSGLWSFSIAAFTAGLFLPVVSALQPAFPIGMLLAVGISGFACAYTAINMCDTREEQGIVFTTGMLVAFQGAAIGLAGGIILYAAIFGFKAFRNRDAAPGEAEIAPVVDDETILEIEEVFANEESAVLAG